MSKIVDISSSKRIGVLTRLMEKMNLSSNSDLTYYALKNKLID